MNTLWLVSIYSREPSEVEYVKTTPKQVHIREQGSRYVEHFERVDGGELVGRRRAVELSAEMDN